MWPFSNKMKKEQQNMLDAFRDNELALARAMAETSLTGERRERTLAQVSEAEERHKQTKVQRKK